METIWASMKRCDLEESNTAPCPLLNWVEGRVRSILAHRFNTASAQMIFLYHQTTLQFHLRKTKAFLFFGNSFHFYFLKYIEAIGISSPTCSNTMQMACELVERQEDKPPLPHNRPLISGQTLIQLYTWLVLYIGSTICSNLTTGALFLRKKIEIQGFSHIQLYTFEKTGLTGAQTFE